MGRIFRSPGMSVAALFMLAVIAQAEESSCEVPVGFDPSAIRLTGNVHGDPPFRGILKHHGWVADGFKLPEQAEGTNPRVVAPAEVEI